MGSLVDISFSFFFFFSLLPHSSRNPVGANSPNPSRHLLSVLNSHLPNPKEIFFTKRPKKKNKNKKTSGARHGLNILPRGKPRVPSETKSPDERFNYFSPAQMPKNL